MAVLKCKMCGGNLELERDSFVATCEFCGTRQTVPNSDDEKKIKLFERANRLRSLCDFDKSYSVYEAIVNEFPEEAEAYWGLVLCEYGIEYVDDPKTGKKVPTCHRSSFNSVMDDANYDLALEYSNALAKAIYREEAILIEEIRKGIVEISSKEEPYDIFICYKETDEYGNRTIDSVIAQDIYMALVKEGYKVFFSKITLEDKLGIEYEPYIFSALHSAKIMLAVGTSYDNFHAVWVKNEWSRYLKFISNGENKTIIPCFKNIGAYDLPKEFVHLQAQDMGKVGAMQDLLRGIGKILPKESPVTIVQEAHIPQDPKNLLARGNQFISDANFSKATEYFEKVLDIDFKCAEAYLGLDMAEKKVTSHISLASLYAETGHPFSPNLKHAMEYANGAKWSQEFNISYKAECEAAKKRLEEEKRIAEEKERKKLERRRIKEKKISEARQKLSAVSQSHLITTGRSHTVGLKSDQSPIAVGLNKEGNCDVASWRDIISIDAGEYHTVGLKSNGTVLAIGKNNHGQCDVSSWRNIKAISAGRTHTVGLRNDGTVVAVGRNRRGECDVFDWSNIISISAGDDFTIGLKADGKVVATGINSYGQCNVILWKDIIEISAGAEHTVGLKADGTVRATGRHSQDGRRETGSWTDIVSISAGTSHTVGLKSDGTVVAVGYNYDGRCNTHSWNDIVAISAKFGHTVALKSDGSVLAIGENNHMQCDVSSWHLFDSLNNLSSERGIAKEERELKDQSFSLLRNKFLNTDGLICAQAEFSVGVKSNGTLLVSGKLPANENLISSARNIIMACAGDNHIAALKFDGTVLAFGSNSEGQCTVGSWQNIKAICASSEHTIGLTNEGRVMATGRNRYGECDVFSWSDIVAVATSARHTVGLRADGSVVAVGKNTDGQCKVTAWRDIIAISVSDYHTVGLKKDGSVVATGWNRHGQCNLGAWENIVAISAGECHTVGLSLDGEVICAGSNDELQCNASFWKNIVAISTYGYHTIGLTRDGTAIAIGRNRNGQCNLDGWSLFSSYDDYQNERAREIEKLRIIDEDIALKQYRKKNKLCLHCGGEFNGVFTKTCSRCGTKKDY